MSRKEFSIKVIRAAFARSKGFCEACGISTEHKARHYDHIIPDAMGGEPTLENCQLLCVACHAEKTHKGDVPRIAKAKRVYDKHNGIKIRSRGFPKREPQRTATRPIRRAVEMGN